jgi:hypothetical protein
VGDPQSDLLSREAQERCPACAAALRPGAPWCTLCYTDLRLPAPEPEPEPEPPLPARARADFDPLTAPPEALGLPRRVGPDAPSSPPEPPAAPEGSPTWPCTACRQLNPLTAADCVTCGTAFLVDLRGSEELLLHVPGLGDLGRFSRGQRIGLAGLVVLLVILLTAALSLLTN